jgi:hypothetical protein
VIQLTGVTVKAKKIFTLLISAIICLASTGQAWSCSYFDDPDLFKAKQACEETNAKSWSCELNRCVTTQEAKDARDEYYQCADIEDDTNRKKCHDDYAKKHSALKETKEPPHMMAAGANAAFAGFLLIATAFSKSPGGKCMSKYIALGTSVAGLLSEAYFRWMAKNKLKELQELYKDEEVHMDAYTQQVRAFTYLKQEQEAIAEWAGQRKKVYIMLTIGYGMAAAMAIFDMMNGCGGEEKQDAETDADTGTEGADTGAETGADTGGADASVDTGPETGSEMVANTGAEATPNAASGMAVGSMIGHPIGVAIVSGIGAGVSAYLWKAAADQEKMAKENAKQVEEVLKRFQETMADFCPGGHEDLTKPRCYCYNNDGSKHENRSNSNICQNLYAQDDKNFNIGANKYSVSSKQNVMGCMTISKQYDPTCQCKKLVNAKGENACFKVPSEATVHGVGSQLGAAEFVGTVNSIASGNTTPANLNTASLQSQAATARKGFNQLLPTLNKELKKQKQPAFNNDFIDRFLSSVPKKEKEKLLKGSSFGLLKNSKRPKAVTKALQKANPKHIESLEGAVKVNHGKGFGNRSRKKKKNNYDFSLNHSSKGLGKFMSKKYKYNEDEIVKGNNRSLWQIITNRYNQSGLKRLFADDLEAEPSK